MSQQVTFVVLSTSLESFKEIRNALASDGRARLLAGGDDADQLSAEIVRLKPNAAIITFGLNPDSTIRLIERLSIESSSTTIISAAFDASTDLILRSLRSGAKDFLHLPLKREELTSVIDRAAEISSVQEESPKKKGRMLAVFSSKGGCGTSFIATNIAASLNVPAVIADLNLQAGDIPLFLGVEPRFSIADLVENRARLDDSLVKSYITPYSTTLSLLAAPRQVDDADAIEPEHVFEVLEHLRTRFDYVVIDPQHTFDAITLAALDQSDDIVLVLTLDIPAIRSAQRSLEIFDRLGYSRKKVKIVVNRFSKMIDLDLRQVEKYLGEPVAGYLSSDYQTAVTSINLGQPLVQSEPDSKLAIEIKQLARKIAGDAVHRVEEQRERRSIWSTFFSRDRGSAEERTSFNIREVLKPSITRS